MKMEKEFQTSDLYLAAALLSEGCRLKTLRPDHRVNRKLFIFDDCPALRKTVSDFMSNLMVVNLRSFLNSWRELRRQVDY
jgi:hypothetical protein